MASNSTANSKTLTLISSDGEEFEVPESAAVLSVTIKNMVEDGCADNPIPLLKVDAKTLSQVIEYLKTHGGGEESLSAEEKTMFDDGFVSDVGLAVLSDYILAANYLNIKGLLDISTLKMADLIKNKSPEWIRKVFGIVNDFSEEEEKQLREENGWAFDGDELD